MNLFKSCEICDRKRLSFLIKKRTYNTLEAGKIKSQDELCSVCDKGIKKLLNL